MSTTTLILLFGVDVIIAYLIGNYQRSNGYSFFKSFIGALMGLIGLTLLAFKGLN